MVLKVGFVNSTATILPCGFHTPPCAKGGVYFDLLLYIVRHFAVSKSMRESQIEVVKVDFYSKGNSSIIGGLIDGYLDISPSFMTLTAQRADHLPYVAPL